MFQPCMLQRCEVGSPPVIFTDRYMLFMFYVCFYCTVFSVSCIRVVICLERADLLAQLCVIFSCVFFNFPIWCIGSGVILDCVDS